MGISGTAECSPDDTPVRGPRAHRPAPGQMPPQRAIAAPQWDKALQGPKPTHASAPGGLPSHLPCFSLLPVLHPPQTIPRPRPLAPPLPADPQAAGCSKPLALHSAGSPDPTAMVPATLSLAANVPHF